MFRIRTYLRRAASLVLAALALGACAPGHDQGPDERYANEVLTRKDRNKDKVYDYERHHFPGGSDADWEYVDTNFDGVYDQKVTYGYTIRRELVNVPVSAKP